MLIIIFSGLLSLLICSERFTELQLRGINVDTCSLKCNIHLFFVTYNSVKSGI